MFYYGNREHRARWLTERVQREPILSDDDEQRLQSKPFFGRRSCFRSGDSAWRVEKSLLPRKSRLEMVVGSRRGKEADLCSQQREIN